MLIIEPAAPTEPPVAALLAASHALMRDLFPPEDNHFLSLDALMAPHIHFYAARDGATVLGTGALAAMAGYGEVKSMFVAPEARGRGVARALLRQIEDQARALHLPLLRLETGDTLTAAHRLYRSFGFHDRGPFGDYSANQTNVFMEKKL